MKHSLVAALAALLLPAGLAWADDAPASQQVSGTITNIVAGANIITVTPSGDVPLKGGDTPVQSQSQAPPKKGSKDLGDQTPGQTPSQVPPKKGGDLVPLKDPPAIQEPSQIPPKKGSKDLIEPSQDPGQVPSQVPPKKGSKDLIEPSQDPGQVPSQVPPKKGSKDLIEPSQDPGQVPSQVPPKKGSKSVGAEGVSLLCDAATSIKEGEKAVGFDALQIGQHVQVTFAPLSLIEPAVVPGKTGQVPSKDEPKIDQVPGKVDQVPAKAGIDATVTDPAPAKQGEEPALPSKGLGKTDGKTGPSKVQFKAISVLILPQEPIVPSKNGKQEPGQVPSKNGKQEPGQVPSKTGTQEPPVQIQKQSPSQVPSKVPAK